MPESVLLLANLFPSYSFKQKLLSFLYENYIKNMLVRSYFQVSGFSLYKQTFDARAFHVTSINPFLILNHLLSLYKNTYTQHFSSVTYPGIWRCEHISRGRCGVSCGRCGCACGGCPSPEGDTASPNFGIWNTILFIENKRGVLLI
jgi:hypothetical protein